MSFWDECALEAKNNPAPSSGSRQRGSQKKKTHNKEEVCVLCVHTRGCMHECMGVCSLLLDNPVIIKRVYNCRDHKVANFRVGRLCVCVCVCVHVADSRSFSQLYRVHMYMYSYALL